MAWLVFDSASQQERVLVLPRSQPSDAAGLERWLQAARKAARLDHPALARAIEVDAHERWPYAAYARAGTTLAERLTREGEPAADVARWMTQALEGLAFAHEAGVAHRDLQLHLLCLGDTGQLQVMGLEVAMADAAEAASQGAGGNPSLQAQGHAAGRDVLALGLLAHHLLAAEPALGEPDTGRCMERLPPLGRDLIRLPWVIPRPVPEALRAIVNRATDRQERHRYHSARTLARALQGWLDNAAQGGDAHDVLLDRVRQVGALPASPGGAVRAARLASLERGHTSELADLALKDLALAFELLRQVNTAQVRGSQVAGNGPVLTVRRAIAMIGLDGLRHAAQGLRPWPGPLGEAAAAELSACILRVRRAARLAQALRPAGYDAEVVYLVTLMQNLGRLLVQYHFPEEAQQIRRLMQPAPGRDGAPDEPGMNEDVAAFAVLGVDIESMGAAVARHWGMDDAVLHMIRRIPLQTPVRHCDSDDDTLRTVASGANEAIDAMSWPARQAAAALDKVAQRYARVLHMTPRELHEAVQRAMQGEGDPAWIEEGGAPDAAAPAVESSGSAA
ncbi:HDOD domain-containing protein [Aquincola sp. MAHUQ-54]|uniref:HDOD domain-containing protein n=1 Tax=Aquincola agrisoli TaxID=3119538 RepID=A0AAW9Q3E6_9BURK